MHTQAGLRVLPPGADRPAGAGGAPEPRLRDAGVGDGGTSRPAAEGGQGGEVTAAGRPGWAEVRKVRRVLGEVAC